MDSDPLDFLEDLNPIPNGLLKHAFNCLSKQKQASIA